MLLKVCRETAAGKIAWGLRHLIVWLFGLTSSKQILHIRFPSYFVLSFFCCNSVSKMIGHPKMAKCCFIRCPTIIVFLLKQNLVKKFKLMASRWQHLSVLETIEKGELRGLVPEIAIIQVSLNWAVFNLNWIWAPNKRRPNHSTAKMV